LLDPAAWASEVPVYESVLYRDVYSGIDVELTSEINNFKYNYYLSPGADLQNIQWTYEGAEGVSLEHGMLTVNTSVGPVHEMRPIAWQLDAAGAKELVRCEYELDGGEVRFSCPDGYDHERELVIDPVLVFSSYSGSTADNWGYTATYDDLEYGYGAGIVAGTGFPVTTGSAFESFGGGSWDVGILKFTQDGTNLEYATYFGGNDSDLPSSIIVHDFELIVLGFTGSTNLPTTSDAFATDFYGGSFATPLGGVTFQNGTDIFLARFTSDGSDLIGCSYVGGDGNDGINTAISNNYGDPFRSEVLTDGDGNIYVASNSLSGNFPTTQGAQQDDIGGGQDAVIFRMSPTLQLLVWSTFWGGSAADSGYSVEINSQGEVYAVGGTLSSDLAMPGGGYLDAQPGATDGYIIRLDAGVVDAGTYLGTANYDQAFFVELDADENVWVTGQSNGPITVSAGVYNNPGAGQFLQKLDADLSSLLLSTTYGDGSGFSPINICQTAFLIDNCNRIFVSGWGGALNAQFGSTNNMDITADAYQSTTDGSDFYIMVLEQGATALLFATYMGASTIAEHVDGGTSRFSPKGIIYQAVCAGCGGSDAFPTTADAWSTTNNASNCNLAVFKFDLEVQFLQAIAVADPAQEGCTPFTVQFTNTGSTGVTSYWDFDDGNFSTEASPEHTFIAQGDYEVMYISIDENACTVADTTYLTIHVENPLDLNPAFDLFQESCSDSLRLYTDHLGGEYDFLLWDFGDQTTSSEADPIHLYDLPGIYDVTVTVYDEFCDEELSDTQTVSVEESGGIEGEVYFPNVISPNTDPWNRDFRPFIVRSDGVRIVPEKPEISRFFKVWELTIYNRWGDEMFRSHSTEPFWDGLHDSKEVSNGTYYYIVTYQIACGDEPIVETSGNLEVLLD
jgi:PKD repeat protein